MEMVVVVWWRRRQGYARGQFLGFYGYNLHNYTRHGRVRKAKKKKTGQGSLNRVAIIGRKRMCGRYCFRRVPPDEILH